MEEEKGGGAWSSEDGHVLGPTLSRFPDLSLGSRWEGSTQQWLCGRMSWQRCKED